jgi:hypothetical protein
MLRWCRQQAPALANYRLFVDAGWFLDIPPYVNRSDGMTFRGCAIALADVFNATFDRCARPNMHAVQHCLPLVGYNCQLAHLTRSYHAAAPLKGIRRGAVCRPRAASQC